MFPTIAPTIAMLPAVPHLHYFFSASTKSGSGNIPSASNRLRASSRAHVCMLILACQLCPFIFILPLTASFFPSDTQYSNYEGQMVRPNTGKAKHLRLIFLETPPYNPYSQRSEEPIHPDILPAFFLVFLAWWYAEKPTSWGIIVRFRG